MQDLSPEKFHKGTGRRERHYDEAGSGFASGPDPMEFIGLMEGDLPSRQSKRAFSCSNGDVSFVYTDKFPERMGFSRKIKAVHIFKIVKREKLVDYKFT